MAISEKSRSALYQGLVPIAGEEAVGEMLSNFAARDIEEPVTKEFLCAEMADLRAEMADVRTDMADVRTGMADLRTEMHRLFNWLHISLTATIIAAAGVIVALGG